MTVHLWPVFSLYIYTYLNFFYFKYFSIQIWLGFSSWENAKEIALPWIPTLEIQLLNAKSIVITQIEEHNQATNLSIAPVIMVIYVDGWTILIDYYGVLFGGYGLGDRPEQCRLQGHNHPWMGRIEMPSFHLCTEVFMKSSSKLQRVKESSSLGQ